MYAPYTPYVPKVPQFLISESMYIMRFLHPIILRQSTIGSNHFWWTSLLSMHLHFLLCICKFKNLWNITFGRKYWTYHLFDYGFGSLFVANYKILLGQGKKKLNKQQPPISIQIICKSPIFFSQCIHNSFKIHNTIMHKMFSK